MFEQLLDGADIITIFQQVGSPPAWRDGKGRDVWQPACLHIPAVRIAFLTTFSFVTITILFQT